MSSNDQARELVDQARELIRHGRELDDARRAEIRRIENEARELIERAQAIRGADSDGAIVAGRMLADEAAAFLAAESSD